MCSCDTAIESRAHLVEKCETHKEERDVSEEEMRNIDECGMNRFGTLDSSEKTIAIVGDRWWRQTEKQEGDNRSKKFLPGM